MLQERIEVVVDGNNTENCHPYLNTYVLDNYPTINADRVRPAVLICPGGGYEHTSDREAEAIAIQMNAMGFQAFVLYYTCAPAAVFPRPQLEAAKAMMMIRENAEKWHVDPNKVIIMGFSAGGHLAASVGAFYNKEFLYGPLHTTPEMIRPSGQVLCYPVITSGEFAHRGSFRALLGEREEELKDFVSLENQVTADTPPAFIWHTYEDGSVPVENSLFYASAMRRAKVPFELHIYPRGGHGLALANQETKSARGNEIVPEVQNWIELAGTWIKNL
ncbi:MAG: alpha/beta hydrolase [Lachnospiraceae bacterium]|nr:alpha/beta hydrolase [Lachnospiraceae bacterium]